MKHCMNTQPNNGTYLALLVPLVSMEISLFFRWSTLNGLCLGVWERMFVCTNDQTNEGRMQRVTKAKSAFLFTSIYFCYSFSRKLVRLWENWIDVDKMSEHFALKRMVENVWVCVCVWKYCSIELIPVWVVTHHYFAYGVHCLVNVGRSLFLRVQKTKVLNALPQNRIAKLNSIIFYLLNGERRNWVEWIEREFGEKQKKISFFVGVSDFDCPMRLM